MGEALARYFEFTPSEISYLKGGKAEEAKEAGARRRAVRRKKS
jgi:hypothetical protein